MPPRLLFTGGGGAGTEAIYRYLGHRYQLHFADACIDTINPLIEENYRHTIPWANSPDFLSCVSSLCSKYSIDILVPGVDEELLQLSRGLHGCSTAVLLPSHDYINIMLDKYLMYEEFLANNLPIPCSTLFDSDFSHIHFPCICKPRYGRGSKGIVILNSDLEAQRYRDYLSTHTSPSLYVIQELIFGQEYTVQMIANTQGHLRCIVPVRVDSKKGITINARIDANASVIQACKKIHDNIPAKGIYNIQLIQQDDGMVIPFEINPRISTTFCLVVASGIDPIQLFDHPSSDLIDSSFYSQNLRLTRFWHNHFI